MKTIQTKVRVDQDRRLTVTLPQDIAPGEHSIVIVIDEIEAPQRSQPLGPLPSHDVGPWPEGFTARREEIYGDDGR